MKRLFLLPVILLAAALASGQSLARLTLVAHWDNGAPLVGSVALSQPVLGASDIPIATKTLSSTGGTAWFSVALATNTNYNVTLLLSDGTQLGPFMFSTVGMDLAHLASLRDAVIFRVADHSVSAQTITVTLKY